MGYVWCDGYVWDMCGVRYVWDMCGVRYVWDMCGVRYANNLLKNPATKRLSGTILLMVLCVSDPFLGNIFFRYQVFTVEPMLNLGTSKERPLEFRDFRCHWQLTFPFWNLRMHRLLGQTQITTFPTRKSDLYPFILESKMK